MAKTGEVREAFPLDVLDEAIREAEKAMPTPLNRRGESCRHPVHHAGFVHDLKRARAEVERLQAEHADIERMQREKIAELTARLGEAEALAVKWRAFSDSELGLAERAEEGSELQAIYSAIGSHVKVCADELDAITGRKE